MSSWKMTVLTPGCVWTIPLQHLEALVLVQAADPRRLAALRRMQKIRRRTERAAHRAVVQRDQANGPDLREARLACGLDRERSNAIAALEAIPVALVRHVLVGRREDRVAKRLAGQRGAGQAAHRAVRIAPGRARNLRRPEARAHPRRQLEKRFLSFTEHRAIEGAVRQQDAGIERRLHSAGDEKRFGPGPAREMREGEIVRERHPGRRDADQVPRLFQQETLERRLRRTVAAVGIEDAGGEAGAAQDSREPPHTERGREEGVLAALGVVGPDEQRAHLGARWPAPPSGIAH
jgi:hypothetical protein